MVQNAQHICKKNMIEAQAQLNSSKFQAQAREAEAEAKGIAARQEEAKIRFEQRLRLTEIDAKLAQTGTTSSSLLQLLACWLTLTPFDHFSGRKMISGKEGVDMMSGFVSARTELLQFSGEMMERD